MQAKRFEALDGWRGIAALAIAFYHVPIAHPLRAAASWKNMELFVDFFFVLSGFVIMHAWGARLTNVSQAREFMAKRFWRIWPLHISILFAFFGIELLKATMAGFMALPMEDAPFTGSRSWASLLTNITMTQSLNWHGTTTWNGPAWSISVEFWTYLVFAATTLLFRAHLGRALAMLAILAATCLAVLSPIGLFATHDYGLLRAIYGFSLGAATYRLVRSERLEISGGTGVEIAILLALASYLITTGLNISSLLAPLMFSGVLIIFAQSRGLVTRMLESRPIQALGLWSYSIYLVHALLYYGLRLVLVLAEKVLKIPLTASGAGNERVFTFGSGAVDLGVILALLVLTIAISAQTYRLIERPFMAVTPARKPSEGKTQTAMA
jgi:peptidoglycan/LPS O-acetylase OafA/YrhL